MSESNNRDVTTKEDFWGCFGLGLMVCLICLGMGGCSLLVEYGMGLRAQMELKAHTEKP